MEAAPYIQVDSTGASGEPEGELVIEDVNGCKSTEINEVEIVPLPEEITSTFKLTEEESLSLLEEDKHVELEKIITKGVQEDIDDDDNREDDNEMFVDETLYERLVGLTEMFPKPIVDITHTTVFGSLSAVKFLFQTSKIVLWVAASSAAILVFPVMFESERAQMEQQQLAQQRQFHNQQILLGPTAAGNALHPTSNIVPPPVVSS